MSLNNSADVTTSLLPVAATLAPPAGEGCPPPLAWQEVLRDFSAQADAWYLDRPRYRLLGRTFGQGPPLYLLNGIGGSHELYALLVWLLKDEFRCVLFDYPGTRDVDRGTRHVTLDDLAADLLAVADRSGDEAVNVYATSFGGLVAQQVLMDQPHRIRSAILQGAFARRELSLSEKILVNLLRYCPGRLSRLPGRVRVQFHNHRRWFPPFDTTRFQFFLDNAGQVPIASLAQRSAIVCVSDFRSHLSQISQPVLLIRGEGEGAVSEGCHGELEQGLPNVRSEWLHGTGHLPYLTHPHRLAKLIRAFLAVPEPEVHRV